MAMDCLTFRKNINAYFAKTLSDDELNEFLHHLSECETCREELEINFIVSEGIGILEEENHDYNVSRAYDQMIQRDRRHIRAIRVVRVFTYAMDTLCFWSVLFCGLLFLHILIFR